uniref:BRISC and BRCA1-A complex member 1 n=1 Tax=Heterosigma akashiwo TaxID=2829 RepID=A0A7S3US84_HETAK
MHQFALCTFGDTIEWLSDFCQDYELLINLIDSLIIKNDCSQSFCFKDLFACLREKLGARPGEAPPEARRPTALYRAVVFYGRSHARPDVVLDAPAQRLLDAPGFFFDLLYIHKRPSEEGVICQEIYDSLVKIESQVPTKQSYFMETSTSIQRLYMHMCMLLTHPAQRDLQENFVAKVEFNNSSTTRTTTNTALKKDDRRDSATGLKKEEAGGAGARDDGDASAATSDNKNQPVRRANKKADVKNSVQGRFLKKTQQGEPTGGKGRRGGEITSTEQVVLDMDGNNSRR